jgi:hypothetical protein
MQKTWFLWCFPFPLPTKEESKSRLWTLAFPLLLLPHRLEFQLTNIISIELGANKISKDMMSSKDFCKLTHKKAFGLYLSSSYPSQQNWRYLKDLLFPGGIIHCKPSCKLKISYLLSFFFFGHQKVLSFPASDYCACFSFLQDSTNQTKITTAISRTSLFIFFLFGINWLHASASIAVATPLDYTNSVPYCMISKVHDLILN